MPTPSYPRCTIVARLMLCAACVTAAEAPASGQTIREKQLIAALGRQMKQAEVRARDPITHAVDRSDAGTLLQLFRSADDPQQRRRIATGINQVGGPGPARFIRLLETEYKSRLRDYTRQFQKQVSIAVAQQRQGATAADIEKLQEQVRDLARDPGLTRDLVIKQGDPAMEQLGSLLNMDRDTVLRSSKELAAARDELLELSRMARQSASHLLATDRRMADLIPEPAQADSSLRQHEDMLAFYATPMTDEAIDVMLENERTAQNLDGQEAESIRRLNLMRIRVGIQPLAIDTRLSDAARDHSQDMATLNFFSHTSPVSGKTSFVDRARNFGATASGENIAHGYPSPAAVIQAWWYSPGHHKNMMNPRFRRIGIGRYNRHWTQMFGS